jgi:hypothetical protein
MACLKNSMGGGKTLSVAAIKKLIFILHLFCGQIFINIDILFLFCIKLICYPPFFPLYNRKRQLQKYKNKRGHRED